MAWRIHENVVRGEIDNRCRGMVRGRIWFEGLSQPVRLLLRGNAAPDLAGCLLKFENPGTKIPVRKDAIMAPVQHGTVGDLTASRKVRVLEMPVREAYNRKKQGLPVPEHMANCLYIEWYSEQNGRVVLESSDYQLTISPPLWRLSQDEERDRQNLSAACFETFLQKLSDALKLQEHERRDDKEWDEFDYEQFLRECDARTDKYAELLDKYKDHPDREQIIAKEMGWDRTAEPEEEEEEGETDADQEAKAGVDEKDRVAPVEDAPELEPDAATEGVDWIRTKDGYVCHPLVARVLNGSCALWDEYRDRGLEGTDQEDLVNLLSEYQTTGAKLGGALDGLAYGRDLTEAPFIVACLKRALNHLHASQGSLEKVSHRKLLPQKTLDRVRGELFAVREEILRLMQEFRSKR